MEIKDFREKIGRSRIVFIFLCLILLNSGSISTANALVRVQNNTNLILTSDTLQENGEAKRLLSSEMLSAMGPQPNSWTLIGIPVPTSLAISPNYAADGKVFIANWGQQRVYLSNDQGQDWSIVGQVGNNIDGITISPNFTADGTMFATSRGYAAYYGGVIRSNDGGKTWSPVLYKAMDVVAISPAYATDQTVFACSSSNGLYRSTNGGNSWSEVNSEDCDGLHFSPAYASDHTVFAVDGGKLNRSTDSGTNWLVLYTHSVGIYVALSPNFASDQTMYFATKPLSSSPSSVYRSTDGGSNWTLRSNMPAGAHAETIRVSPDYASDGAVFVVATNGFFRSINQASTWTKTITRYTGGFSGFVFSPAYVTDGTIYTLINGGLVKSIDHGVTWQALLPGDTLTSILRTPSNELFVTLINNSTQSSAGALRSADDGVTWTITGADAVPRPFSSAVSPDYTSDHTLFFGQANTPHIFRSTDSGSTWSADTLGSAGTVWAISVSPDFANDHTVFAGIVQPAQSESVLYRSTDSGQTWQASSLIDPNLSTVGGVYAIAISPNYSNDHTLFAATYSGMFKSTDHGDSWSATTAPEEVRTIAISPDYASDHTLFIGVDRRILRSEDNGDTWQVILQDNLPPGMSGGNYKRIVLSPNFATDGMIFASRSYQTVWSKSAGACWDHLGSYGSSFGALAMDADNGITLFNGESDVVLAFALNPATLIPTGSMTGSLTASSPVPNDGVTPSNITVTLKDAYCNPVIGQKVTLYSSRGSADVFTYQNTTTNASGQLFATVTSSTAGNATITAVLGYSYIDMNAQSVVEFHEPIIVSISGRVTVSGGVGLPGVTISDGAGHSAVTDGSGYYTVSGVPEGSYTFTPSLEGYNFSPPTRTYTDIDTDQTGQDYIANTNTAYTISGNAGTAGATLSYTDVWPNTVMTNGNGDYTIFVSAGWSGTVTPAKAGYSFSPANIPYSNIQTNKINQNYVATKLKTPVVFVHGLWSIPPQFIGCTDAKYQPRNAEEAKAYFKGMGDTLKIDGGYADSQIFYAGLVSNPCYTPPIKDNVSYLKTAIDQAKAANPGQSKVIIIAHSMGGLVARAYIEGPEYEDDVEALFTFGSPHLGTPPALLSFLANGISLGKFCKDSQPALCDFTGLGMKLFNNKHHKNDTVIYHAISGDAPFFSRTPLGKTTYVLIPGADDGIVPTDSGRATSLGTFDRWTTDEVHDPIFGSHTYFIRDGAASTSYAQCIKKLLVDNGSNCGTITSAFGPQLNASTTLDQHTPIEYGLLQSGQTTTRDISVEGGPTLFASQWQEGTLVFTLVDPYGQTIEPAFADANSSVVSFSEDSGIATYYFPNAIAGTWQFALQFVNGPDDGVTFGTFAAFDSSVALIGITDNEWYAPGATAILAAMVTGSPSDAAVDATIKREDGINDTLSLSSIGNGQFLGFYTVPNAPGYAEVTLVATGTTVGDIPFERGTTLAFQISPNTFSLNDTYADTPVPAPDLTHYQFLDVTVGINASAGGKVGLSADLVDSDENFVAQAMTVQEVATGATDLVLRFDGTGIFASQHDGPYTLTNVLLTDESGSALVTQEAEAVYNTGPYLYTEFDIFPPIISSISRADLNPTSAASVNFTVMFSESVTGVDASDFSLVTAGLTGAAITDVSGSGSAYTVTVGTGSGNGKIRLEMVDDDSITDLAGNPLGGVDIGNGDFTSGEIYDVNKEQILNGGYNLYPTNKSKIPTNWKAVKFAPTDGKTTTVKHEGTASIRITGTGVSKTLSQTLLLSGSTGDPFTFSFWVKGSAIPKAGVCRAQILFYNGVTLNPVKAAINCGNGTYLFTQKQLSFTAPGNYTKIVIRFTYSKAGGRVWFDAVSLMK